MITPVIMCGGVGARLWPLSRALKPKQFHRIFSKNSLYQETLLRFKDKEVFSNPVVLCSESERFYAVNQAAEIGITLDTVICEPLSKNTFPAIGLVALHLESLNEDNMVIVVSSDHYIKNLNSFLAGVKMITNKKLSEGISVFGVKAQSAHTGYGYISLGKEIIRDKAFSVSKFHEKPTNLVAKRFLKSGKYLWNMGMFAFKPDVILSAINNIDRNELEKLRLVYSNKVAQGNFLYFNSDDFSDLTSESIDKKIIEKLGKTNIPLNIIKLDLFWTDIGSWSSLYIFKAPNF